MLHPRAATPRPAISIVCPTRGRVAMLGALCESIHSNTLDKQAIEVLFAHDHDDLPTRQFFEQTSYPWLRHFERSRGTNISRDYVNWLVTFCDTDFIIVINDDCVLTTYSWDQIILRKLHNYLADKPDGIVYGWISDVEKNMQHKRDRNWHFSCFPLISRAAINVLGYMLSCEYPGWGADGHIYNAYKQADRVLDISEVVFKHISSHYRLAASDATHDNMKKLSKGTAHWDKDGITHEGTLLVKYIKEFRLNPS